MDGCPEVRADFLDTLERLVDAVQDPEVVDCAKLVSILDRASETIPLVQRAGLDRIWDDSELKGLKKERWDVQRDTDREQ